MEQARRMLPSMLNNSLVTAKELISEDRKFNESVLKDFVGRAKLQEYGATYTVVAIMGPQSSGKSTLMNHLFDTNFKEMDGAKPSCQTTRGVWIAKAKQLKTFTIVLDLEGTDGQERGKDDDTAFERQTGAFALAVADVIIVNMWCKDIGLENASNRPLLKAIFQAMLHLFGSQKKTLLFVIRDKKKTWNHTFEEKLKKGVEEIWESATKPESKKDTPLAQYFNLMVTALSDYEHMHDTFKNEVAQLRSQLFLSPPTEQNQAERVIPFKNAKEIWDIVKQDKNLDLPSQKTMIATVRCEEIANDKLKIFKSNKNWIFLKDAAATALVTKFNAKISSILDKYLKEYDHESKHFEEDVRKAKREYLKSEVLKVVRPAYVNTLNHERADALQSFVTQLKAALDEEKGFAESVRTCQRSCELQFNEKCQDLYATFSTEISNVRDQLLRDIEHHWESVQTHKLPQIEEQQKERLSTKFRSDLKLFLIRGAIDDIWVFIRVMLESESEESARGLSSAVVEFDLDAAKVKLMVDDLKQYARKKVVTIFKEETKEVQDVLRNRFVTSLSMKEDKEVAYKECAKLLLAMAVLRLDEGNDGFEADFVSALMGSHEISPDPFASKTWQKVPRETTLITPLQCRKIWDQFKLDVARTYAKTEKIEVKDEKVKRLPTWVKVGLVVLGSGAFFVLLRLLNLDVVLAMLLTAQGVSIGSAPAAIALVLAKGLSTCKATESDDYVEQYRETNSGSLEIVEIGLKEIHSSF